ncbi:unnamed protein product [Nippostrongylus brasiliensis]|uniref:Ras-GEF domain-containing protein n=1 Tax=Nippostrongylus brasiliensis TaxID=27835 RepID=A0A0N4XFQ3_NIPBR|nr:unnamed protein product [Nippostrongylus brasiliensis]
MTSIVLPDCRPDFRAKIIAKWIDIARELRALKNFSSLKAVLSSLQSEPVHRLKSVWALVPSRSMAQFRDLSSIYDMDEEGDERNARRILDQEGTAKSSPLRRPQLVQNCRRTKSDVNLAECQGTVPYLGSFLTDLTMIDQGTQDYTEEGLINFEKRRKEFEVLAKLRLFQSAARAYHIPMDRVFCAWFHFLPCLSEKECFNRSLEIEQPATMSTPDMSSRHNTSLSNGNSSGPPKSSTLSRLFNSSRSAEDSITNVSQSHSHSQSQSSFAEPMLDGMSGVSPAGIRMSNENCTKFEEWIDGRVDGGPPGPVSSRIFFIYFPQPNLRNINAKKRNINRYGGARSLKALHVDFNSLKVIAELFPRMKLKCSLERKVFFGVYKMFPVETTQYVEEKTVYADFATKLQFSHFGRRRILQQ